MVIFFVLIIMSIVIHQSKSDTKKVKTKNHDNYFGGNYCGYEKKPETNKQNAENIFIHHVDQLPLFYADFSCRFFDLLKTLTLILP